MPEYERILAGDIRPGDIVGRTRSTCTSVVASISPGRTSVWIKYDNGSRDRPRKTAKWWKFVADGSS